MRYSISKLTEQEYTEIKNLFHSELPAREIAEKYNLAVGVVTDLFRKEYSEEATKERIQKCTKKKKLKIITTTCEACNKEFTLKKIALVQMKRGKGVFCPECKSKRDHKTQEEHICPVCGLKTHRKHGLTSHIKRLAFKKDDQAHLTYFNQEEAKKWEGQILGIHYVECQICKEAGKHFSDYRLATLHRHVPSVHRLTIPEYQRRYPERPTIATASEIKRIEAITANHASRPSESYQETKSVRCETCNLLFQMSKYQSDIQYPHLCPTCKKEKLETQYFEQWEDKVEGVDYVECKVSNCSVDPLLSSGFPFRTARSLKDHLRFEHALKLKEYEAQYSSAHYIEDKMPGCGTFDKIKEKEREVRLQKGLKVYELNICLVCLREFTKDNLIRGLCSECITREEDQEGNLSCKLPGCAFEGLYLASHITKFHKMSTIGYCHLFPKSYLVSSKLRKKMSDGTEKVSLNLEDLEPFMHKDGKVILGLAAKSLGVQPSAVRREAEQLGLALKVHHNITQTLVMELLSEIINQPFTSEQTFDSMRNPETNHQFRFDGYFSALDLIVEYHGYQHYLFPNHVHKNVVEFKAMQDRDYLKRELAIHNDYFYLAIRFDEPYEDITFLKSKLKETFGNSTPWTSKNLSKALEKARANIEVPFLL